MCCDEAIVELSASYVLHSYMGVCERSSMMTGREQTSRPLRQLSCVYVHVPSWKISAACLCADEAGCSVSDVVP